MMSPSDLECALSCGADAVGFVVAVDGSRHSISAEDARELIAQVPVFAKSVAVIAPKDVDEAVDIARRTGADLLQIHSSFCPEDLIALKDKVSQKVIAAVSAGSNEAYSLGRAADAVLIDTFKDGRLGGTGIAHDWNMSAAAARGIRTPVILAGGLNASNVAEAISMVKPYAVDVSSGVETGGRKDPQKAGAFIRAVRMCP
jgi:phosphoribosylanthranilate isomerase